MISKLEECHNKYGSSYLDQPRMTCYFVLLVTDLVLDVV